MTRAIAVTAALALVLVGAAPTIAATNGPMYNWRYAELAYASETGDAVMRPASTPG